MKVLCRAPLVKTQLQAHKMPATIISGGEERTAADVHTTLCALVTTNAADHSAWADYAAVLVHQTAGNLSQCGLVVQGRFGSISQGAPAPKFSIRSDT